MRRGCEEFQDSEARRKREITSEVGQLIGLVYNVMKIIDVIGEEETQEGISARWRALPDSALLKGRNPFFVPDFPGEITITAAIAVKINKLGKGIPERFAARYYAETAPAVIFRAEKYGALLRASGYPDSAAYSFDKAVIVGEFHRHDLSGDIDMDIAIGNDKGEETERRRFRIVKPCEAINRGISQLSRDNTLKTGDLLLIDGIGTSATAVIDSHLTLLGFPRNEQEENLNINIK